MIEIQREQKNIQTGENRASAKRTICMIGIIFCFVAGISFLLLRHSLLLDELLCLLVVNLVFIMIFVVTIIGKRQRDELPLRDTTGYGKLFFVILLSWIGVISFSYIPDYFAPSMLLAILLCTVMDQALALGFSIYLLIMHAITGGLGMQMFYCYCLLAVLGVFLASYLHNKRIGESIYLYLIIFLIHILLPITFYYMAYLEIKREIFVCAILEGLFTCVCLMGLFPLLDKLVTKEKSAPYLDYIEEDYPLAMDIKRFSVAEYNHALRVSKLSAYCAKELRLNADCAACAGFYYRLGKIEGEPEIDNALRIASNHCFPKDVMAIMEEYGGVLRLPQTPESAIVHMVDCLVTKIELLDADTMSSTWNQDMVIYQTLNELSQKGFYDESGLSMNQFLRIRETLVKEDSLL